jgi:hypothetical protein
MLHRREEYITDNLVVFRFYAIGLRFLCGIAESYNDEYDAGLAGAIKQSDFERAMFRINRALASSWPCLTCYLFGYGCAPCTLGVSLLCPRKCSLLAEKELRLTLSQLSLDSKYWDRRIEFRLATGIFSSCIEILVPESLLLRCSKDIEEGSKLL